MPSHVFIKLQIFVKKRNTHPSNERDSFSGWFLSRWFYQFWRNAFKFYATFQNSSFTIISYAAGEYRAFYLTYDLMTESFFNKYNLWIIYKLIIRLKIFEMSPFPSSIGKLVTYLMCNRLEHTRPRKNWQLRRINLIFGSQKKNKFVATFSKK